MAVLTDMIEFFIKQQLENDRMIEIRRNEMAQQFDCAPSQINYVLSSRFTIENGYAVQSRRGGGGYIRIIRLTLDDKNRYLLQVVEHLEKEKLTFKEGSRLIEGLRQRGLISEREAAILTGILDPETLEIISENQRDQFRSVLLQSALQVVLKKVTCHLCPSCKEEDASKSF